MIVKTQNANGDKTGYNEKGKNLYKSLKSSPRQRKKMRTLLLSILTKKAELMVMFGSKSSQEALFSMT